MASVCFAWFPKNKLLSKYKCSKAAYRDCNMTAHSFFTGYVVPQNSKCNIFSVKFFRPRLCYGNTHFKCCSACFAKGVAN